MNARQFVDSLVVYLNGLRADGQTLVPMDGVISNLAILQKIIENAHFPISAEKIAELQGSFDLEYYRAQIQAEADSFKSVISTATEAIKALFLINGGGCVALLTLMGQLAPKLAQPAGPALFAAPLLAFAIGVGMAAVTACLLNLGQKAYHAKHSTAASAVGVPSSRAERRCAGSALVAI